MKVFAFILAAPLLAQTVYQEFNQSMCPLDWEDGWTVYYWGSCDGGGSMITEAPTWTLNLVSNIVPATGNEYEMLTNWYHYYGYLGNGPMEFVQYLRASGNVGLRGNYGTFYAIALYRASGSSNWTITIYKRKDNVLTTLLTANTGSNTHYPTVRSLIRSTGAYPGITVRFAGLRWYVNDTSIASGSPGLQIYDTPYLTNNPDGRMIGGALYLADQAAPNPVTTANIAVSRFPDRIELAWNAAADTGAGASGVRAYEIYRNGAYIGEVGYGQYVDFGANNATASYTMGIRVVDHHGNASAITSFPVAALQTLSLTDPRRTGIVPTGAYWGALGEQIDTLSGNVNYTIPLLKAIGRGGSSVGFSLNYNSQLWRLDNSTTVKLGADVGYGYGWKLLAGAITPIWTDPYTLAYYLYTDSTGAEHKLHQREGDTWTSTSGAHVWYNSASKKLYFGNGSFWRMESISADSMDLGSQYPTLMQDANGNQIVVRYRPSIGGSTENTSARIQEIEDVRATDQGGGVFRTYQFNYNNDAIPHLTGITNTIGTSETYTFSTWSPVTLWGPFVGSPQYGMVDHLRSVVVNGLGLEHYFEYNTAGEITKVKLPYGAELGYTYAPFTFIDGLGGTRTVREVSVRTFKKAAGATAANYAFTRDAGDSNYYMHTRTALADPSGVGWRAWLFSAADNWARGIQWRLDVRNSSSGGGVFMEDYTWAITSKGQPYLWTTLSTMDVGQSYQKQWKTEQLTDAYGNIVEQKFYGYGSLTTWVKKINCSYAGFLLTYQFRLPVSCSVTDGASTLTSFTNTYDSTTLVAVNPAPRLFDPTVTGPRGNRTVSVTPYVTHTTTYNVYGGVVTAVDNQGHRVDATLNAASGLPTAITPNQNTDLNSTISYNGFLGLTAQTQANTYSTGFSYDAYARPASETNRDGGVTTFTYSAPGASPAWKKASQTTSAGTRYTQTYFDGIGRPVKTEVGTGTSTVVSTTETEYDSCACSPVGKMKRVSMPYAPGGTKYWTTYSYDGLGRTLYASQPNSSGSTSYQYTGNSVRVTGASGKWKKMTTDVFGQLIQVDEPKPGGGTLSTTYTYNLAGKLTQVSMPRGGVTQTRTFAYDTATQSRLLTETLPETGTTSYTYYADGKLQTKTDARNKRLQYNYDVQGRLTNALQLDWNGSAWVHAGYAAHMYYDTAPIHNGSYDEQGNLNVIGYARGLLASIHYVGGNEEYSYSPKGRPWHKTLSTQGISLKAAFTWNEWGQLTKTDLPRTARYNASTYDPNWTNLNYYEHAFVSHNFNALGQATSSWVSSWHAGSGGWSDTYVNANLAANGQYNAAGQLSQLTHYTNTGGTVTETRAYNTLGQMTRLTVPGAIDIEYQYSATANDGRAVGQKNWLSGEEVQYTYDSLARLTKAETVGPGWGQAFGYDDWGNLYSKSVTKGSAPTLSVAIDGWTNRITGAGFGYDGAGNMTSMPVAGGTQTLTYDHHSRVTAATNPSGTENYNYDLLNRRMLRTRGSTTDIFFYGAMGELLGRYRAKQFTQASNGMTIAGPQCEEMYFYFAGRRVAKRAGSASLGFWGSPSYGWIQRLQGDRAESVGDGSTYYPYGEEKTATANDTHKFATYYRDAGSGLDYAHNRYYSSTYGRFTSPDPYRASGGAEDPGSWNRYAYVQGDPVNANDPSGLATCYVPGFSMGSNGSYAYIQCVSEFGLIFRDRTVSIWPGNPHDPIYYAAVLAFAYATLGMEVDQEEGGPPCEIYVKLRPVQEFPLASHAYIEVRDPSAAERIQFFEGGPQLNPPNISIVYQPVPVNLPNLPFPITIWLPVGISIDFGQLVTQNYERKATDSVLWGRQGADWCETVSKLRSAYNSYQPSVRYQPGGPNSNSFVSHLLTAAGVQVGTGLNWLPGWGVPVK